MNLSDINLNLVAGSVLGASGFAISCLGMVFTLNRTGSAGGSSP